MKVSMEKKVTIPERYLYFLEDYLELKMQKGFWWAKVGLTNVGMRQKMVSKRSKIKEVSVKNQKDEIEAVGRNCFSVQ